MTTTVADSLTCCEPDCDAQFSYSTRGPRSNRRCETCRRARTRALARENTRRYRQRMTPEDVARTRARYREWYERNAEKERADSLAWYYANTQRVRENRKAWDLLNSDYNRKWVEGNRDRHNAKHHRRRAREADAFIEHVDPAGVYRRDRGTCYLCRRQVPRVVKDQLSPALDHVIPLARGGRHSYENVRLTHHVCNARKGAREVMPHAFT